MMVLYGEILRFTQDDSCTSGWHCRPDPLLWAGKIEHCQISSRTRQRDDKLGNAGMLEFILLIWNENRYTVLLLDMRNRLIEGWHLVQNDFHAEAGFTGHFIES